MLSDCLSESDMATVHKGINNQFFRATPPKALAFEVYDIPDWAKPPEGYVPQVGANIDLQDCKLWLEKMTHFHGLTSVMSEKPLHDVLTEADLAWLERCYQRVSLWQLLQYWCDATTGCTLFRPSSLSDLMDRVADVFSGVNPLRYFDITNSHVCCEAIISNGQYADVPVVRYIVALQAAILGNFSACLLLEPDIFKRRGYSTNRLLLYLLLFSKPYRNDWAVCPMQELVADLYEANRWTQMYVEERVWGNPYLRYDRIYKDIFGFLRTACYGVDTNVIGVSYTLTFEVSLITAWPFLHYKFFGGAKINSALPLRSVENTCRVITEVSPVDSLEVEAWHCTARIQSYYAQTKPERFPKVILGLNFNAHSNAILPAFFGQDMCGMSVLLVPVMDKVRALLSKFYQIPQHNALYPENRHIRTALQPTRTDWPEFISRSEDFVYLGLVNLADFLEQRATFSDLGQCPAENLCHLLYIM